MKIISKPVELIPLSQMKSSQIAVIRKWPAPQYIGRIVQRYGDALISIGQSESSWPFLFAELSSIKHNVENFQVEILPPGTKLEI